MKKYFIIINIILVAVFFYFSVQVFSEISGQRDQQDFSADSAGSKIAQSDTSVQHPFSYYSVINRRNLFNTGQKANTQADTVDIKGLKQTNLKLKLLGTVTGNKNKAYAVIEDLKERKQNLYRVGDSLQNATVKIILREKVVLNINGKDEILGMKAEPATKERTKPVPKKRTAKSFRSVKSRSGFNKSSSRTLKTKRSGRKQIVRSPKPMSKKGATPQ